ncbi:MAG: hypothetical protein ABI411_10755 [Tahibacter sp.]
MRSLLLGEIDEVSAGLSPGNGPVLPAYCAELGTAEWHRLLQNAVPEESTLFYFSTIEVMP